MPKAPVFRRGTAMPDSDVSELVSQHNIANDNWTLSTAIALSGVTYSVAATWVAHQGTLRAIAASTGAGFTAFTIATGNVAVYAAYITQAGTHAIVAGATAGSFGVAVLPVVPSTALALGVILIKASGGSAFTGGTTVLDGTNASAVFINLIGPSGMALSTAPITKLPG